MNLATRVSGDTTAQKRNREHMLAELKAQLIGMRKSQQLSTGLNTPHMSSPLLQGKERPQVVSSHRKYQHSLEKFTGDTLLPSIRDPGGPKSHSHRRNKSDLSSGVSRARLLDFDRSSGSISQQASRARRDVYLGNSLALKSSGALSRHDTVSEKNQDQSEILSTVKITRTRSRLLGDDAKSIVVDHSQVSQVPKNPSLSQIITQFNPEKEPQRNSSADNRTSMIFQKQPTSLGRIPPPRFNGDAQTKLELTEHVLGRFDNQRLGARMGHRKHARSTSLTELEVSFDRLTCS